MFIPLEGDNILCLANVIAVYKGEHGAVILRRNGKTETSYFMPWTLRKRGLKYWNESLINGRRKING